MKNFPKLLTLMLLPMCLCNTGCKKRQEEKHGMPPVPVVTAQATKGDLPKMLNSIGRCKAYNEVDIVSEVNGEIVEIAFEEGASVEKGQKLFKIDERKYQATLASAEAELARCEAQLSIDLVQLERSKSLINKDYISKQEFDTYQARVAQDEAGISAAKAAIARAKVDVEHCTIRAPFSGVIGKRSVDMGAVVDTQRGSLATICQMSPLSVEFFVSENDFPELKEQFLAQGHYLDFEVALISDPSIKTSGTLKFLDNKVDSTSGVIHLKGEFQNDDYKFWPGNTVRLAVHLKTFPGVIMVPVASLRLNSQGKTYVYLVKNDESSATKYRAVQTFPEIGFQDAHHAEVRQGVAENDVVILHGNMLLGNGSDVIPTPDAKQ